MLNLATLQYLLENTLFQSIQIHDTAKISHNTGVSRPVYSRKRTESAIPYTGLYGSEITRVLAYFTRCNKRYLRQYHQWFTKNNRILRLTSNVDSK